MTAGKPRKTYVLPPPGVSGDANVVDFIETYAEIYGIILDDVCGSARQSLVIMQ